ncbi:SPOR domain-containing protein [Carboxylicivirga sp. N1Y90]|uniref:SPOR domain-containing protein n=1 Tax=Carboxylicivirga fragile TaxID=3417571 RepID=UPI003D34ED18|nr:SPOR domain-containing protein [Marinilabiliaceae bacterium N1Y90]
MKLSTLVTLILAVFIFSSCASLKKGSSSFDDSDSPYLSEQTKPTVKKEVPKKIVVKEEKVTVVENTNAEVFKYYVIIGSFKVLDNAKNYKKELSSEGFTPVILENEKGLYRVSVSAYNEEQASRTKIGNIRSKYEKYNDVWLLIRKK